MVSPRPTERQHEADPAWQEEFTAGGGGGTTGQPFCGPAEGAHGGHYRLPG